MAEVVLAREVVEVPVREITPAAPVAEVPVREVAEVPVREITPVAEVPVRAVAEVPVREVAEVPVRAVTEVPVREITPVAEVAEVPVREITPAAPVAEVPVREVVEVPVREITPAAPVAEVPVREIATAAPVAEVPVREITPVAPVETSVTIEGQVGEGLDAVVPLNADSVSMFELVDGSLPEGVSLGEDGSLIGAPTADGATTATIALIDVSTGERENRTIEFTVSERPMVATESSTTLMIAELSTIEQLDPVASGNPTTFELVEGALPTGLVLEADGAVTGSATVPGEYTALVLATDTTTGAADLRSLDVSVEALNRVAAPVEIQTGGSPFGLGPAGASGSVTAQILSGSLPTGITLNSDGTFSGSTSVAENAQVEILVTDTDTGNAEIRVLNFSVTAPVATAPAATAPVTTAPVTTAPAAMASAAPAPVTTAPVTTAPVAMASAVTAPVTAAPVTTAPVTTAPAAMASAATAPVTAAPVTMASAATAPVTAAPVTTAPAAPAPAATAPVTAAAPVTTAPAAMASAATATANPAAVVVSSPVSAATDFGQAPSRLAFTGASSISLVAIALALLAIGTGAVFAGRRRNSNIQI